MPWPVTPLPPTSRSVQPVDGVDAPAVMALNVVLSTMLQTSSFAKLVVAVQNGFWLFCAEWTVLTSIVVFALLPVNSSTERTLNPPAGLFVAVIVFGAFV